MKLSKMAAPEFVIFTIFGAASDENFVKCHFRFRSWLGNSKKLGQKNVYKKCSIFSLSGAKPLLDLRDYCESYTGIKLLWIKIRTFSFKKIQFEISSANFWPSCLGLHPSNNIHFEIGMLSVSNLVGRNQEGGGGGGGVSQYKDVVLPV